MSRSKTRDIEYLKKRWDEHAHNYDEWYETFEGAAEHYVEWELLKRYLPKNRSAKILDAAGGTGRITLPLAKMGYSVTLCDISPGMLDVARKKLYEARLLEKVEIVECDVSKLRFDGESFDFVLCWDGMIEATKELVRVTKKGGSVSIFLINKYSAALSAFRRDPDSALALLKSEIKHISHHEEKHMVIGVERARELFEKEGIKVFEIYAVCGMLQFLSIPEEVRDSRTWDKKFFRQVTETLLLLSKESSVKGLSRHLVVYGKKI